MISCGLARAARRAALAAAGGRAPRRHRQGTGKAWVIVCPLRRWLHRVRVVDAGEDVTQALRRLGARFWLRLNKAKSVVARPQARPFLVYRFRYANGGAVKWRIAPTALVAMKERVRRITTTECGGGWSIEAVATERRGDLTGWKASFRQAEPRRSSGAWIDGVATGSGRANSHRGSEAHPSTGRGEPAAFRDGSSHAIRVEEGRAPGDGYRPTPDLRRPVRRAETMRCHLNQPNRRMRTRTSGGVGGV